MDILHATALGLVQGATEFLPVSSSGHLVLTRSLLGVRAEGRRFAADVGVTIWTIVGPDVRFQPELGLAQRLGGVLVAQFGRVQANLLQRHGQRVVGLGVAVGS